MSLTDWVRWDSNLIDTLFDKPIMNIKGELKAEPLTKNYATVGAAFDYILRLLIAKSNRRFIKEFSIRTAVNGVKGDKRRRQFIIEVLKNIANYLNGELKIDDLLSDCVVLAKLESVYRSGKNFPNSDIFHVEDKDVVDLQHLIEGWDSSDWIAENQLLLNPTFGESSLDVGGADADLIIDGKLIDIKTTKELKFRREYFRQLVGYHILNMREHAMYGSIEYLGLYFSRFGMLFTFPTPEMNEISIQGNLIDAWKAIEESLREYQNA